MSLPDGKHLEDLHATRRDRIEGVRRRFLLEDHLPLLVSLDDRLSRDRVQVRSRQLSEHRRDLQNGFRVTQTLQGMCRLYDGRHRGRRARRATLP